MTRRHGICVVLWLLVAAGWLLGAPGAAFAVKEREPLKVWQGPPCGSGPQVGKAGIKDLKAGGVKVKVRITSGAPNALYVFGWTAIEAPSSCDNGVDQMVLGTITTDGLGRARFVKVLPGGNPFPGKFVRIDTDGSGNPCCLYAPFANIFQ